MEILAAYDLTGSYRKAAELVCCDHHTVRRYVALRRAGTNPSVPARRAKLIDDYMPKIEELIEASRGKIGADHVHKRLVALGFTGSDRTTSGSEGLLRSLAYGVVGHIPRASLSPENWDEEST